MAEALGSGCSDLKQASVRILNEKGETVKEFSGEEINPYEAVFAKERKTLDVAVDIDESDSCSACFAALTAAVNRLREEGKWPPQRLPVIAIGQGHRNKKGEFGIGNCCRNFIVNRLSCGFNVYGYIIACFFFACHSKCFVSACF